MFCRLGSSKNKLRDRNIQEVFKAVLLESTTVQGKRKEGKEKKKRKYGEKQEVAERESGL